MASKWHQKKNKLAEVQFEKELQSSADDTTIVIEKAVAVNEGEEELFERKLSKEEKKARAKAAREAKRKAKKKAKGEESDDEEEEEKKDVAQVLQEAKSAAAEAALNPADLTEDDGIDHEAADVLAAAGTICTFATSRKGVDNRSRDINVTNFTLQHMGAVMLDETEIVLNHGNRYGE